MARLAPEELISRHYDKLAARPGVAPEKLQQLLSRAGLISDRGRVHHAFRQLTPEDCRTYKRAVQEVFGDAVYSFAKVNFVLGGCMCGECAN